MSERSSYKLVGLITRKFGSWGA